jgi:tetratricopeptide (TPR) repeat protein
MGSVRRARAAADEAVVLVHTVDLVLQDHDRLEQYVGPMEAEARVDAAIDACRTFLARHPSALVEAKLGWLLHLRGRHTEALARLDRALALDPTNDVARLESGIVRSRLHLDRAAAGAEPAELDALRDRALDDLAVVDAPGGDLPYLEVEHAKAERARRLGRLDEAERRYREVARLAPHVETPPALAALALARGDPDEAFRQAMSAVDLQRGFAPAYAARASADASPAAAVERAIRQHARASVARTVGTDARLEIDGLDGRFTDWAARLAERTSTAGAYAHRASGELRRAGRLQADGDLDGALAALESAITSLGHALTIDGTLADALGDRALAEHARAALHQRRGERVEADAARERARVDLDRALELAPESAALAASRELLERAASR